MAVQWKFKNTAGGNVPADLVNRVQTLETDNTTNKTNIATNTTNITNLNNEAVKKTGNQDIAGVKTLKSNNMFLLKPGNTNANLIQGFSGTNDQRIWYFGKGSSSSNDISFAAEQGKLLLSGNSIDCNNKKMERVANPTANTDAANKAYVDAIKAKIKEVANASTDFADFKTKIANW